MKTILVLVAFVAYSSAASRRDWRKVLASPDIPSTSFSCTGRPPGYYADLEANCQVYHMCTDGGRQYSYLCPNTTLFHQRMLICAHWYQVDCSRSPQDYTANLLIGQKDRPFVDEPLQIGKKIYKLKDNEELQKLVPATTSPRPVEATTIIQRPKQSRRTFEEAKKTDLHGSYSGSPFHQPNFRVRSTEAAVTEQELGPTNVSFRSTIETPLGEDEVIRQHTEPMTSAVTTPSLHLLAPLPPSPNLLPPFPDDHSQDPLSSPGDTNTVEIRLDDPRVSLYIPDGDSHIPHQQIVVSIPVKGSRFKAKAFRKSHLVKECLRCHPGFLVDKINCSPCLIVN